MEPAADTAGGGSSSGAGGSSSSRWNPTKEQLSMLEGLYGQGIRTPSAEQIQSITTKLQAYGHIEGKNVFYWFQNHKARQRQKQKMDQMNNNVVVANNSLTNNIHGNAAANSAAYLSRFYYPSPPVSPSVVASAGGPQPLFLPPAPNNVAYSPFYIGQPEYEFYQNCPKMVLPNHILNNNINTPAQIRGEFHRDIATFAAQNDSSAGGVNGQVTLNLFPLHPTGILEDREHRRRSPSTGSSVQDYVEGGSDQVQASPTSSRVRFDVIPKR